MDTVRISLSRFLLLSVICIVRKKNKQTMMNNTVNAIKNILEGINNRITEKEE